MIRRVAATLLAAALGSVGAPLTAAAAASHTAVVDVGGAQGYVRADAAAPLAGVALFVRAGLDRQTGAQNGLAALVAESVLRTPVDGTPLADAVDARGGSIAYAVSPSYVRFFLEAPPGVLAVLAPLVARALAAPAFDVATLTAARAVLAERIAGDEADPRLVGVGMLRASYYRGGAGLPSLGTAASSMAVTPEDARAFFARWYLRGDAFVASVGSTGAATDAASRAFVAALPAGSVPAAVNATRAYGDQPKRFVTHRDVSAPYVVIGFGAPPLGDKDFPAALVLRSLLGDLFDRVGATTVPTALRAAGSLYAYDAAPAQFALWINGARVDPSTAIAAVGTLLSNAAKRPLTPAVLSRYKESARGEWALEALSLDDRAAAIGNAVALGLDADASDAVASAVAQVTAADVQRVAKRYFQRFDVALVLPRGGG